MNFNLCTGNWTNIGSFEPKYDTWGRFRPYLELIPYLTDLYPWWWHQDTIAKCILGIPDTVDTTCWYQSIICWLVNNLYHGGEKLLRIGKTMTLKSVLLIIWLNCLHTNSWAISTTCSSLHKTCRVIGKNLTQICHGHCKEDWKFFNTARDVHRGFRNS